MNEIVVSEKELKMKSVLVARSKGRAVALFNNDEIQTLLVNLYDRWQDEKEYEDFFQYGEVIRRKVEEVSNFHHYKVEFQKAIKRPFGFLFKIDGIGWSISVNSRSMKLDRVS